MLSEEPSSSGSAEVHADAPRDDALLACLLLLARTHGAAPEAYALGDWPAPFGIVLVLDQLAAL